MNSRMILKSIGALLLITLALPIFFADAPVLARPPFDSTPVSSDFKDPKILDKNACARDRKNLIRSQIGRSDGTRGLCKHAVMADVPAELRQRDKHLSRIVNQIPVAFVAQGRSAAQQLRQRQIQQRCRRPNPVKFD